jgi:hypothetical protein
MFLPVILSYSTLVLKRNSPVPSPAHLCRIKKDVKNHGSFSFLQQSEFPNGKLPVLHFRFFTSLISFVFKAI